MLTYVKKICNNEIAIKDLPEELSQHMSPQWKKNDMFLSSCRTNHHFISISWEMLRNINSYKLVEKTDHFCFCYKNKMQIAEKIKMI